RRLLTRRPGRARANLRAPGAALHAGGNDARSSCAERPRVAASLGARRRLARAAGASDAERRRARCDEAARSDAAGDAVRPRHQLRHQSQSARRRHRRRRRSRSARVPATRRAACGRTVMSAYERLDAWVDAHFDEEVKFLQALVRVPTDTPPGNNAPHAERTAALLEPFGFEVEKHAVPEPTVRAYGLASITNL